MVFLVCPSPQVLAPQRFRSLDICLRFRACLVRVGYATNSVSPSWQRSWEFPPRRRGPAGKIAAPKKISLVALREGAGESASWQAAAERQNVNNRGYSGAEPPGIVIAHPVPRSGFTIARRMSSCRRYAASVHFCSGPGVALHSTPGYSSCAAPRRESRTNRGTPAVDRNAEALAQDESAEFFLLGTIDAQASRFIRLQRRAMCQSGKNKPHIH